jgi:Zn-dependent protease with chaperone function
MAMASDTTQPLRVERWPSERPLAAFVALAAIALWVLLAVSIVGLLYALLLAAVFFLAHVAFVTHLRGNAVRLGPEQMPELWQRVRALAERIGMRRPPEAYVMQAGGALNALATKFLRSNFIVLYSDLLDACGDNEAARDFIVAHELGHLHAGHLRLQWLLLPGLFVPLLGTAYSRAREYTCDRYGLAASSDPERALDGLCILAAGGERGPRVNRRALVAQRNDLESIWMKLGHWLATHPPIAHRLGALEPALGAGWSPRLGASLGAAALVALAVLLPVGATFGFFKQVWPKMRASLEQAQAAQRAGQGQPAGPDPVEAVRGSILSLRDAAESYRAQVGAPPASVEELYGAWAALHPGQREPLDPWHATRFGYHAEGGDYWIFSEGPNASVDDDDLWYSSRPAAEAEAP